MHLTDWRGNDYTVGDHILYPTSSGSSCYINEAIVLEIIPYEVTRYNYTSKLSDVELCHKVKVQKVREEGGYGKQPVTVKSLKGTAKASTLTNIGRITKVDTP